MTEITKNGMEMVWLTMKIMTKNRIIEPITKPAVSTLIRNKTMTTAAMNKRMNPVVLFSGCSKLSISSAVCLLSMNSKYAPHRPINAAMIRGQNVGDNTRRDTFEGAETH